MVDFLLKHDDLEVFSMFIINNFFCFPRKFYNLTINISSRLMFDILDPGQKAFWGKDVFHAYSVPFQRTI